MPILVTTRMRLAALFLTAALIALAACDAGGPEPPGSAACDTLIERADTLYAAVGERTPLDLDGLFAGVGEGPLTYAVREEPANGEVMLAGERGEEAEVEAASRTAGAFVVEARAECGVVAEAAVSLLGIPPGADCSVRPRAADVPAFRVALGGAPMPVPAWGEGGVFEGAFDEHSALSINSLAPGWLWARKSQSTPPGHFEVNALATGEGTGEVRVTATDVCFHTAEATVTVEAVPSPTCSLDHDPAKEDYFPLAVGNRWRYHEREELCTSTPWGNECEERFGEEVWEVASVGTCTLGRRPYVIERNGFDYHVAVAGDSLYWSMSPFEELRRLYPAGGGEEISIGGAYASVIRLKKGVGPSRIHIVTRQPGHVYNTWTLTLLEGP